MTLSAVEHRFGRHTVIGPVDLRVATGECVGLVGSNGAGKTTLMRLVLGLTAPHAGSVAVWGSPVQVGRVPEATGAVIEEPRFYPWLDAVDNLLVACAGRRDREHRIEGVLDLVGLTGREREPVRTYSQGMRQRLGLARALLGDPRLLVLDEPTNGLDPQGIRWLRDLVRSKVAAGTTVVLSSHLLGEVQLACDTIAVVAGGSLLTHGQVCDVSRPGQSLEDLYFELLETGA